MKRRDFLKTLGQTAASLGALGWLTGDGLHGEILMAEKSPFLSVPPGEVGIDSERLQQAIDFVSQEQAAGSFPGAALAATRHGRLFLERYWGTYSSSERRDNPYDGGVVNMVYSFSKAISATVVVMAHQKGFLDYDVPVSSYLPEFKGGGKEAITVRHLLTHAAGLPTVPLGPVADEEQWDRAIATLCAAEVEWEPGSRTAYHALSGLLLAAEVVRRKVDRKPWEQLCREWLFEPLGAKSFTFQVPSDSARIALTPQPSELPWPLTVEHFPHLGHPAGGAFATPIDMLRLLQLHLNEGLWQGQQLLEKAECREMQRVQYAEQIAKAVQAGQTPTHEFWGLAWLLRGTTQEHWFGFGNALSERTFGHAGINTVIGLADPESELALVFLTTDSPRSDAETVRLRNTVTNLVARAMESALPEQRAAPKGF